MGTEAAAATGSTTTTDTSAQTQPPAGTSATTTADAAGILDGKVEATTGDKGASKQQADGKAGDAKGGDERKAGEGTSKEEKPAETELELKLPDGFQADEATLKDFKSIAKEAGLKGEAAQKIVDLFAKFEASRTEQAAAAQREMETKWTQVQQGWVDTIKADPELGKDLAATKATALRGVDFCGGEPVKELLRKAGLTSHPVLVKAFHAVGKALGEDSIKGTQSATPTASNNDESFHRGLYSKSYDRMTNGR
jgi:hypothetical protein